MKITGKWNKLKQYLGNSRCYHPYYHSKLDEKMVVAICRDGKDLTGNILRILQEISKPEYGYYKIYLWARKSIHGKVKGLCKNYNIQNVKLVTKESHVVEKMERAKYIVTDIGVPWKYVKRDGQIVLNTWHGTPFKVMGRRIASERHAVGTVQHMFFSSDYTIYPSDYMRDTMLRDYMVENVLPGKVLMTGYPRNSIFFDDARRNEMRRLLGLEGKKVSVYMPTHRESMGQSKGLQQLQQVTSYLTQIDSMLDDSCVMFVKLHVFNQSKIDFTRFRHVVAFPEGYETYDVLNTADCLITDYSSVFFDFANSRRKIVLFPYDEEEYFADRGTYFPFSELPFPNVKTPQALVKEMNSPKEYDDTEFVKKFCTYDSIDATEKLCRQVFKGEECCLEQKVGNGKENVLIFAGGLIKNGITTSLLNLLNNIDLTQRNYYICFRRWELDKEPERLNLLPPQIEFLPLMSDQVYTLRERLAYDKFSNGNTDDFPPALEELFNREIKRYFWGVKFSHVINFDGYGKNIPLLFAQFQCKKTIYVHNDMVREVYDKGWQHAPTLKRAYNLCDNVAVVSEDIVEPTVQISGNPDNIRVVQNIHDYLSVRAKSKERIAFRDDTEMISWDGTTLVTALRGKGYKIITIGRFSAEKAHKRLIDAFNRFCEIYPDSTLIIIGGYGDCFDDTVEYASMSQYRKNIIIIKSVDNPFPILSKCDLFVLPSEYEGLGLVILEADCLGIPSFSTNVNGPRGLMTKYNGYLVDNSCEGVYQGMLDYVDGKVSTLTIDYEAYNQNAISEFYSLL